MHALLAPVSSVERACSVPLTTPACPATLCARSVLSGNQLRGQLPPEWGQGFEQLRFVEVSNNQLSGGFPAAYSQASAFPSLENL